MTFAIGNLSRNDTERAVLPTILFAKSSSNNKDFDGQDVTYHVVGFAIGWWKWGVRVTHVWAVEESKQ